MNFQIRFGDEDLLIDLEAFFKPMLTHLLQLERNIMTAIEDINTKVDGLATEVTAGNAKVDTLLAGYADVQARLAELLRQNNSGGAITAEDVAALSAKIDAITGSVKGEETKVDAALAPAPAPAPAPDPSVPDAAPTTPAADAPTADAPAA